MTTTEFGRDHHHDFDMDSPEFNEHYYDVLDDLVANCPVARSEVGHGYWVINRYEDVRRCAQDWQTFTSTQGFQPNRPDDMMKLIPVETDPPYHHEWRKVLNPFFSPGAVAKFENSIRDYLNGVIDGFIERGECDFVRELAAPLPGTVFFNNLIGVPVEDLPQLKESTDAGLTGPVERRGEAWGRVGAYVDGYLRKRSQEPPRGDVIDVILKGFEFEGEQTPWEVKLSVVVDLMSGGLGTTAYVLASAVHYLAEHPDQRKRLRGEPGLLNGAVEEFIRYFSANYAIGRTATCPARVGDEQVQEGDFVMISWAAANRDPALFDDPGVLDLDRNASRHVAFGIGPHRCIGSNLARIQLRLALEIILERIPDFELAPGTSPTWITSLVREIHHLHLVFPPGLRLAP